MRVEIGNIYEIKVWDRPSKKTEIDIITPIYVLSLKEAKNPVMVFEGLLDGEEPIRYRDTGEDMERRDKKETIGFWTLATTKKWVQISLPTGGTMVYNNNKNLIIKNSTIRKIAISDLPLYAGFRTSPVYQEIMKTGKIPKYEPKIIYNRELYELYK